MDVTIEHFNNTQTPEKTKKKDAEKIAKRSRQCPICHVFYKFGNSYWQHVRYVHGSYLSQCVICEKCYKRTTMTKHHILHSHKIAWHLCGNYVRKIRKSDVTKTKNKVNESEKKNNLRYHKKKTLHLIKCFNCYYCPGSFATIDELFGHVKIHKKEKRECYYEYTISDTKECTSDLPNVTAVECPITNLSKS